LTILQIPVENFLGDGPIDESDPLCYLLEALRREKLRLLDQLEQTSRTSARLATLWAAVERLHASTQRSKICEAVEDIVLNVVGGEQCAIFEVDRSGAHLNLIGSVGVDPQTFREVGFGEGLIGRVAASGRMFVKTGENLNGAALWEETLSACIPLKYCGRLTGVIAILGMQLHKLDFNSIDLEMFDLLSRHAAMALHAAAESSRGKKKEKE
jgi:GAF domain-containing protein